MAEPAPRRRTFVPVAGAGLAAGAVAAVSASRPWAEVEGGVDVATAAVTRPGVGESPLASTLSLVVLAAWGTVLVTRGRVRRAVAGLALLASSGLLVVALVAGRTLPRGLEAEIAEGGSDAEVSLTGWYWLALAAALVLCAASLLAVLWVPAWPQMGGRYDAPTARQDSGDRDPPATPAELWRAIDEGHDPTA